MTKRAPITKAAQTEATTQKLVSLARGQFAKHGYAHTGTEALVQAAGVTRGALYHHFKDKQALFRAVLDDVQRDVARRVDTAAGQHAGLWDQLVAGCRAFLSASTDPDTQQIMLIDGPAVLGWDVWREMDSKYSLNSLKEVLRALMDAGDIARQPIEALAHLLSGAMNEAALWVARSAHPRKSLNEAMAALELLMSSLKRK